MVYEDFVVPRFEGRLRRRKLPPHIGPTIALVARQRRFLRAAYALADQALSLEAEALLRSLFDFLVCQEWLALDPEHNLALLVKYDQAWKASWQREIKEIIPQIEQTARARLSDAQRKEVAQYEAALPGVLEDVERAIGDRPSQLPSIRERARATELDFLYLVTYKSASHLSHSSIYAIDALSEMTESGVRVTAVPPPHREPRGIYVRGGLLLREALDHAGRQWARLRIDAVERIGSRLEEIQRRRLDESVPGWSDSLRLPEES